MDQFASSQINYLLQTWNDPEHIGVSSPSRIRFFKGSSRILGKMFLAFSGDTSEELWKM
jgi:hypothetical protein